MLEYFRGPTPFINYNFGSLMRKLVIFLYFVFLFKIAFAQSLPSIPKFNGFGDVEPAAGTQVSETAQVPSLDDDSNDDSLPADFDIPVSGEAKKKQDDSSAVTPPAAPAAPQPEITVEAPSLEVPSETNFEAPSVPATAETGPILDQENPEVTELPRLPDQNSDADLEKELTDDSVRGQFPPTPELNSNMEKSEKQKAVENNTPALSLEDREKEVDNLLDQVFDKQKTAEQLAQEKADQEAEEKLAAEEKAVKQDDSRKVETVIDVADTPVQPIDDLKSDDQELVDLADLPASMKSDNKAASPFGNVNVPAGNNSYTYNEQQLSDLLVKAAMRGDKQSLVELIHSGRNVNAQNIYGESALMGAVYNGHNDIVEILLSEGADANVVDNKGNSSLLVASAKNNIQAVQHLIRSGSEIDLANNASDTPLLVATLNNNIAVVDLLTRQGADINKPNADGLTALHIASYNGNAVLAKHLLAAGANPGLIARGGFKPYDLAKDKNPELAQTLTSYTGPKQNFARVTKLPVNDVKSDPYAMYSKAYQQPATAPATIPVQNIQVASAPQNYQSNQNEVQKADYSNYSSGAMPRPASLSFSTPAQAAVSQTPIPQAPLANEKKWTKLTVDPRSLKAEQDAAESNRVLELARAQSNIQPTQPVIIPAPQVPVQQVQIMQQPQPVPYQNYAASVSQQLPVNTRPVSAQVNNYTAPAPVVPVITQQDTAPLMRARYDNNGNVINTVPVAVNHNMTPAPVAANPANNFSVPASMSKPIIATAPVAPVIPVIPVAVNNYVPVQQPVATAAPQAAPYYNQPISNNINLSIPRYADLDSSKQAVWDKKLEEWVMNGININAKDDSQRIFWMKQQAVLEKVYQEQFSSKVENIKRKIGGAAMNVIPAVRKLSANAETPRISQSSPAQSFKTSFLEEHNSAFSN